MRGLLLDAVFPWWAFVVLAVAVVSVAGLIYSFVCDLLGDIAEGRPVLRHRPSVGGASGDLSGAPVPSSGISPSRGASANLAPPSTPSDGVNVGSARATGLDASRRGVSGPAHPVVRRGVVKEPRICVQQVPSEIRRRYREASQEAAARAALYPRDRALDVLPVNTYAPAAGTGRGA